MKAQDFIPENTLTRSVLFEKAPAREDNYLYVYAYPDIRCKNPTAEIQRQLQAGNKVSEKYGLTKAIDFQECIWLVQKDTVVPRVFQSLMKLVILGKVKHIYVDQIRLFSTKQRSLVPLYIQMLSLFKVKLYDRDGLVNIPHVDCRKMPWGEDLEFIINMFDTEVKNPLGIPEV